MSLYIDNDPEAHRRYVERVLSQSTAEAPAVARIEAPSRTTQLTPARERIQIAALLIVGFALGIFVYLSVRRR